MKKEIKQINKPEKPKEIDFKTQDMEKDIDRFSRVKKPLLSAPTHTPTNFYEMFEFYDGSMYVYINNTWSQFTPV